MTGIVKVCFCYLLSLVSFLLFPLVDITMQFQFNFLAKLQLMVFSASGRYTNEEKWVNFKISNIVMVQWISGINCFKSYKKIYRELFSRDPELISAINFMSMAKSETNFMTVKILKQ